MHSARPYSPYLAFTALLFASCVSGVKPNVDQIQCKTDNNCPTNYQCSKAAGASTGRCVSLSTPLDGGASGNDSGAKADGALPKDVLGPEVTADTLRPGDATVLPDTQGPTDSQVAPDTVVAKDTGVAPDTTVTPDKQDAMVDAPVDAPVDTTPPDTGPPCRGGCCTNADCPLAKPLCNAENACVACTADKDCAGRPATACNLTTGACVQCTKSSQCGGATAACDTATNTCVGCTQRSDCPGTCQTCSNGSCVALKNADDAGKCAGTCDATGECKAKKGQGCTSLPGGCIAGTTCSPDGVCCDRACSGSCEACDLPASLGTCTVLPSGTTPRAGHTACAGTGTCAGTCAGATNGSCTFPTGACGTATCSGTTQQAAGTCKQGTCDLPAPVTCKTGAACSGTACACPGGTSDCGTSCANLDSDPKNCGVCGHDCQGGPCEGGFCRPFKLGDVAAGRLGSVVPDGNKVYAITQQQFMNDTTKVWQFDASTPGTPVKIPPDMSFSPSCVIDGTLVWANGATNDDKMAFSYCSTSGCLGTTQSFNHAAQTGGYTNMQIYPACDAANKEIVWAEEFTPTAGGDSTFNIYRASVKGANLRKVTSFPKLNGATEAYVNGFASGRTDRIFFTRTTGTTIQVLSVSTSTANATPVVLASGSSTGPLGIDYATLYANDSLLVWKKDNTSYRMPLPNGVGSSTPPQFSGYAIGTGIMDNYHFYGILESGPPNLQWCSVASCSMTILSSAVHDAQPYTFAQDDNAVYWAVVNETAGDGFAIWKVAKQKY